MLCCAGCVCCAVLDVCAVPCWMCCAVLDQTPNTPGLLTFEMNTNYPHISYHPTPHSTSCHAHPAHLLCPAHLSAMPTLQVVELRPSHSVLHSGGDVPPGCRGRRGWTLLGGGGGHTLGCPILGVRRRGEGKGRVGHYHSLIPA